MRLLLTLAFLLALAACTATPTQCVIHPLAILPTVGQLPFVPVLVQNQPATLMVDTGAVRSVLNMSIVQAAHMTTDQPGETIVGIGGRSDTIATVPSLTIGYATAHDVSFFASRFASRGPDGKPIDGLFGGDFLVNYDLLIDLPAHRVGLYETEGCAAATFAPFGPGVPNMHFGTPGSSVEFDTRVAFQAELDGVSMPFILDSGSARSLITIPWADRTGLRVRALSDDPVIRIGGLGDGPIQAHLHRFKSLQLPVEVPASPVLGVYDGPLNLIGDDFLRHNRVWVSYPFSRLYVQPVAQ